MKVAIVHYWLNGMRGGEKVLENICSIYPNADIYTHVLDEKMIKTVQENHPFAKKNFKNLKT